MQRATLWFIAISLMAGLLSADDRKKPAAVPQSAARPAAPTAKAAAAAKPETSQPAANGRSAAASAPAKDTDAVQPLSLAYVPRDAIAVAAIRPPALVKCQALAPFCKLLDERLELEKELGFRPERIEQIAVAFMLVEGPAFKTFRMPDGTPAVMNAGGRTTQPEPVLAVFHLSSPDDAVTLATAIHHNGEEQSYAGRTYTRKNQDGSSTCVLVDGRTVVVGEEPYLRRSIVAGPGGASQAKWARAWQSGAAADALALVNVALIRNLMMLKMKELEGDGAPKLTITPPSAAALLDAKTALVAIEVGDTISARLQLAAAEDAADPDVIRIRNALKDIVNLQQAGLSSRRETASADAGEKGSGLLSAVDILDSALDSMTIETQDRIVAASLTVGLDDVAKAILAWVSMLADESENGVADDEGASAPVPADAAEGEDGPTSQPKAYFPSRLRQK